MKKIILAAMLLMTLTGCPCLSSNNRPVPNTVDMHERHKQLETDEKSKNSLKIKG